MLTPDPALITPSSGRSLAGSAATLRQVMAQFASGVTVVTALRDEIAHAMTATALCSVSLEPPLILVCVGRASRFHDVITHADSWCVSLLANDQESVARHFANRGRDLRSQFDRVPHTLSELGANPILDGALAWMECTTYAMYDGGDHTIVVGQIERASAEAREIAGPLTYHRGTYSGPPTTPPITRDDTDRPG